MIFQACHRVSRKPSPLSVFFYDNTHQFRIIMTEFYILQKTRRSSFYMRWAMFLDLWILVIHCVILLVLRVPSMDGIPAALELVPNHWWIESSSINGLTAMQWNDTLVERWTDPVLFMMSFDKLITIYEPMVPVEFFQGTEFRQYLSMESPPQCKTNIGIPITYSAEYASVTGQ